jgi:hypothetical protein
MNIIKIRIREAERRVTKISQQGPCVRENICFAQLLEELLACAGRACVEDTVGDVVRLAGLLLGPPDGVRGNVDAQHLGEAAR